MDTYATKEALKVVLWCTLIQRNHYNGSMEQNLRAAIHIRAVNIEFREHFKGYNHYCSYKTNLV